MKIVFTTDFLYHSSDFNDTYHFWCADLFNPIIKMVSNQDVIELKNLKNKDGKTFSREKFYALSGIDDVSEAYYHYDVSLLKKESFDYLKTFFNKDIFVLGIELGNELKNILSDLGVVFLNFWFHSWKLFDDSFFMINTNDKAIFDVLKTYQVPKTQFEFYANYWKIWRQQKKEKLKDACIQENSILFVGQTLRDKSTDKDGKYLNILDFKERLYELSKEYSHIYYIPHPYVSYNRDIEEYINSTSYITKLNQIPTYDLLMSDKVKKVIGISSSVLYEAKFFGKDVEYLFRPLFNIDADFKDDTFISVYHDYFNPTFWKKIFENFTSVFQDVPDKNLFFEKENKFRNIKDLYYGYASFNEHKILEKKLLKRLSDCDKKINNLQNYDGNIQKRKKLINFRNMKKKISKNFFKVCFYLFKNPKFEYKYKKAKYQIKGKNTPVPFYKTELSAQNLCDKDISVLINGTNDTVTLSCIQSIRATLPNSQIIFSTWDSEKIDEELQTLCDKIILNKDPGFEFNDPERKMPNNLLRILHGIQSGLPFCERKYTLRIRSDLGLKGTDFLKYFNVFSKRKKKYSLFQHKILINAFCTTDRIVQNGFSHLTPFHISDWFHFGLTEDVVELFKLPKVDDISEYSLYFKHHKRLHDYPMDCIQKRLWKFPVEQFIGVNNSKKIFKDIKFDDFLDYKKSYKKLSQKFILNNFIVLEGEQSNLFSKKEKYVHLNTNLEHNIHPYLKQGVWTFSRYVKEYCKFFKEEMWK